MHFGGAELATTVVSGTQLTATGTSTTAQKGMIKVAVENPDPGKITSTAFLNVQVGAAGQVNVIVIRHNPLHAGDKFNFRTAVNGAAGQTAVKWAINGIPGGNATVGTISAGGAYTAPKTIPSPNTLQITATSLLDTTATSTGTITFINAPPVVTAVLPTDIPVGDFTLVVSGQKFVSGAVVSFGGTFLTTKFVSSTQLVATGTATAAEAGTVQVTVINPDPGSATSNSLHWRSGLPPGPSAPRPLLDCLNNPRGE